MIDANWAHGCISLKESSESFIFVITMVKYKEYL